MLDSLSLPTGAALVSLGSFKGDQAWLDESLEHVPASSYGRC